MISGKVLRASVTPLASIFGSGFLIIVPVLERTLGALSVIGVAGVCALAWCVGTAIRHNVACVEPLDADGSLDVTTRRVEEASDLVIVVAYVISVALYLRIMAQYVVDAAGLDSGFAERGLACGAVVLILALGLTGGFSGLDLAERLSLGAVLVIVSVLGATLFVQVVGGTGQRPPVPDRGIGEILLVLAGIVITVQGFETVRYLADEYDAETRIWACRLSQLVATAVYVGFVVVATPVLGIGTGDGPDETLLDITGRVVPLLTVPVVVVAVLSQFSAATADTVAANGNLQHRFSPAMRGSRPLVLTGAAAIALIWTVPTFTIVAVASRAFAAYYALQCVVALRTSDGRAAKVGFGLLAAVLVAVTLLAQPVG